MLFLFTLFIKTYFVLVDRLRQTERRREVGRQPVTARLSPTLLSVITESGSSCN